MTTPTKAEQLAEATARAAVSGATIDPISGAAVVDDRVSDIDDNTGEPSDDGVNGRQPRQGEDDATTRTKPIHMSPADEKRAEMAKRFKRQGAEEDVPFNGNMSDPEMIYGEHGRQALDPDPIDQEQPIAKAIIAPEPAPKKTLTVRGKQVEMTDDEILAAAQKTLAGDSYLDEARALLEEAKQIKAERSGRAPQHPAGEHEGTQDDGLNPDAGDRQHPDELEQAIEQIQFGDPKEAAQKIRNVIKGVAESEADEGQMRRLVKNDIAKAQAIVKTFSDNNKDIASDPIAAQALEQFVYAVTREEIIKLGDVDASKIPQNPAELANWHRFYRINGRSVSNHEALLESAKGRYLKWKGVSEQPKPAPTPAKPRVEVNVDRTVRRENIPNQPTRSVAPRPDAQTRPPQGDRRTLNIMAIRAQRGQTVA